ncbi:hypothetical protein ACJJIL_16140 [Microbulbifer sp. EKSA005]|uniref:hypothetical protein n=1 Tax=Microbulbifer sp. EKSA005 TaxID=3243364 RepID=UPI004041D0EE
MKDNVFKGLNHPIASGETIATTGQAVTPGYKPDITINDAGGSLKYILESEQKTDRKAFLGDLMKAEMYSENISASPELIIVMQVFSNTTTEQIADHIRPYANWLASKNGGSLSLSAIQVVSDQEYAAAILAGEILGSRQFKARGHVI